MAIPLAGSLLPFLLKAGSAAKLPLLLRTAGVVGRLHFKRTFSDEIIFKYLKAPINDLDLLIRTGGDQRISNFLLYHLAYSEIQFTETLWPDFTEEEFLECLKAFSNTERRFGKRPI